MGEEAPDSDVGDDGVWPVKAAETEVEDRQRGPSVASETKRGELSGEEAAEAEAEDEENE